MWVFGQLRDKCRGMPRRNAPNGVIGKSADGLYVYAEGAFEAMGAMRDDRKVKQNSRLNNDSREYL